MKRIPALISRSSFSHGVPLTIYSQFVASICSRRFYARVLVRDCRSVPVTDSVLTREKQSWLLIGYRVYIDIHSTAAIASRFRSCQKNHADLFDFRIACLMVELSRSSRSRRKLSRYLKVIGVARTLLRDEYVS